MKFINRSSELARLERISNGLIVLFGRRRVGKTSLIEEWGRKIANVGYSQAIEGAEQLQISQLCEDLRDVIPKGIVPRSWQEFLSALALINEKTVIVLDEFPYLVRSNSSLPSLLQRWLDHDMPDNFTLVLLGSSQTMMHGLFMESTSPLYERAREILHVTPMGYRDFCKALKLKVENPGTFNTFSLIGGIPKYWEFVDIDESAEKLAGQLFFQKGARLEFEPDRLLKDENISGQQAKSIFEAVGRGASRPSEIASRLGIKQTTLSKPLQILRNASLIEREGPFPDGSSESKRSLYKISDFALRFWYRVYSPHRSRWHLYDRKTQRQLIHEHAATVLEDCFRQRFPDARRYWEGRDIEIDCVRYDPDNMKLVHLTEIKNGLLTESQKRRLEEGLRRKFIKSALSKRFSLGRIEVLDVNDVLASL